MVSILPLASGGCWPPGLACASRSSTRTAQELFLCCLLPPVVTGTRPGVRISQQHQDKFLDILVQALGSTTAITDAEAALMLQALHLLDSAVVNATLPGCGTGETLRVSGLRSMFRV